MLNGSTIRYLLRQDHYFPVMAESSGGSPLFRVAHEVWDAGSGYEVDSQSIITLLQIGRGSGTWQINHQRGRMKSGQVLVYGLDSFAALYVERPLELRLLCLTREALPIVEDCLSAPGQAVNLGRSHKPCWDILRQILAHSQSDRLHKQRLCNSLVRVWLDWCLIARSEERSDSRKEGNALVVRAKALVESRLDRLRCLADLATLCACSEEHLCREFAAACEIPPWHYIRRRQMQLAGEILRDSRESMEEVAFRFGYNDRYAFAKAFKKYCGFPPGKCRRNNPHDVL